LEALGQINEPDHEEMVRERIFHRVNDGGVGIASMQRCNKAAYVAAFLQAAPILIDTKEEIDGEKVITTGAFHEQLVGILGVGSFDGGKLTSGTSWRAFGSPPAVAVAPRLRHIPRLLTMIFSNDDIFTEIQCTEGRKIREATVCVQGVVRGVVLRACCGRK
jgi:hypothetical protein